MQHDTTMAIDKDYIRLLSNKKSPICRTCFYKNAKILIINLDNKKPVKIKLKIKILAPFISWKLQELHVHQFCEITLCNHVFLDCLIYLQSRTTLMGNINRVRTCYNLDFTFVWILRGIIFIVIMVIHIRISYWHRDDRP